VTVPRTENSSLVNDLGLDSLDLVSITIAIESQWPSVGEIEYDPSTMETVRDLARFVESRLGADSCLTPIKVTPMIGLRIRQSGPVLCVKSSMTDRCRFCLRLQYWATLAECGRPIIGVYFYRSQA